MTPLGYLTHVLGPFAAIGSFVAVVLAYAAVFGVAQ